MTNKTYNLLNETPESVADMLEQGIITEDQGREYFILKKLEEDSYFNLDPEDAAWAYENGIISEQQAEDYYDKATHPLRFRVKDVLGRGSAHAVRDFLQEGLETLQAIARAGQHISAQAQASRGFEYTPGPAPAITKYEVKPIDDVVAKPATGLGAAYKSIAQTGLGFVGGFGAVGQLRHAPKLKRLAFHAPRIYRLVEASLAGAVADGVFYDPYEERLSNLVNENVEFGKALTDFLKADPEDSIAEAKLKAVLEGMTLGLVGDLAVEGVRAGVAAAKVLKGRIWRQNAYLEEDVVREVDERLPVRGKVEEPEPAETTTPPKKATEPPTAPATPKKETDDPAQAYFESKQPVRQEGPDIVIESNLTQKELQDMGDDLMKVMKGDLDVVASEAMVHAFRKIDGPEDMLKMIHYTADKIIEMGDSLKGGVWKDEELQDLAADLNLSMNDFRKIFGDTMDLPIRIRAYMGMMTNYAKYVYDVLAPRAIEKGEEVEFIRAIQTLYEMQNLHLGVRASVGRSLRAYQEVYSPGFVYPKIGEDEYRRIMEAQGDQIRKIIAKTRKVKSDRARLLFARQVGRMKYLEGALELTQASYVSGYKTQLVNLMCNAAVLAYESTLHNLAILGYAGWKGDKELALRAVSYWHGAAHGLMDAVRIKSAHLEKLKPEDLVFAIKHPVKAMKTVSKIIKEDPEMGTVWKALWGGEPVTDALEKVDKQNIIPDFKHLPLGSIIRFPFRFLTAGDEFFKSIAYRANLHSFAFEEGYRLGLRGDKLTAFTTKAATHISRHNAQRLIGHLIPQAQSLHAKALKQARINTFTEELGSSYASKQFKRVNDLLSPVTISGDEITRWHNTAALAASLPGMFVRITAIPFFKIMANITRYALQNTPLGLASKRFADDITSSDPIKRIEALGRIMAGTAIMGMGLYLYKTGQITGHIPATQRDAAGNAGITAYSFNVDGRWVDYNRFDPLGSLLGLGANVGVLLDLVENAKEDPENQEIVDDYISAVLIGLSDPILNKTWATGALEVLEMFMNPERNTYRKWLTERTTQFIPFSIALKDVQQHFDGIVRELYDYQDGVLSRFNSKAMAPRRHPVYGTIQTYEPHFMGLLRTREESTDIVLQTMAAVGANVEPIKRKQSFWGIPVEMSREMFIEYGEIYGSYAEEIRTDLLGVIETPWFQQSQDNVTKAGALMAVVSGYRERAKGELYDRHSEWFDKKFEEQAERITAANEGLIQINKKKTIPLTRFTKNLPK